MCVTNNIDNKNQVEALKRHASKNRKLLDESLELDNITMRFFSDLSHELKTPLNVIYAAIQTISLYNTNLEEYINKRAYYFDVIKHNCYRLTKTVNNLLDITKLDAGLIQVKLKNENIITLIEEIVTSSAPYVEKYSIDIIFDTEIEEKIIACDCEKIERILLNLISNSIKFTNFGGTILISVFNMDGYVAISVKDTGIGIKKENFEMIFDRFTQIDKTITRKREGSGIGLSIVKSFVEMHNGSINVLSTYGNGSEFLIKLPSIRIRAENIDANLYKCNKEKIKVELSDIYI